MKKSKIIALTIISVLGLAACGGSDTPASAKTSVAESSASAKQSSVASSAKASSAAPASSAPASSAPASSAPISSEEASSAPISSEAASSAAASSEVISSEPISSEAASSEATSSSQSSSSDSEISVPDDSLLLTYHWNYDGAPDNGIISQTVLKKKRKATVPETPVYDGHYFVNWYSDAECTTVFNFDTQLTETTDIYAKWYSIYTFEAEYLDFDKRSGNGFSGNANETEMICKDDKNAGASNGYYVSYLYYNGCYLDFNIVADEDVTDAVLICRFSAEFYDIDSLSASNYGIYINGWDDDEEEYMTSAEVTGYDIALTGTYDVSSSNLKSFEDYVISKTISLNKGDNMISLVVENDTNHGGTLHAESPIVDCIKVACNETLSWADGFPKTDNIKTTSSD